jgi:polysaccharide pyruvyl transferase WcaK-like protein
MHVVLFGLPYSPNVGDGIIAECLAHAIRAERPGARVTPLDLSGRTGWGAVTVRNRGLALRVLRRLPRRLREPLVLARLARLLDAAAPAWTAALADADLAVIGGGQLFSDADLNFPAKIARAAGLVAEARVPLAIHAVGVARNWSPRGAALFRAVLAADLRRVGVRDALSAEAWRAQMPGGPAPVLARDPGLLAAACYGPADPGPAVGLCVTAPGILGYHADAAVAGAAGGLRFWSDLAEAVAAAGHPVRLFCNGAEEDRAALARLAATPPVAALLRAGRASVAPPPATATDLAQEIRALRAVVAHRLHACILAHAWARPAVGLGWDRKVESFFASVGQSESFVGAGDIDGRSVAARLDAALARGVDPATHAAVLAETRAAVAGMLAAG